MSLSRNQRIERGAEEWLEELEDHIENSEYSWAVEIANNIAQIGFKEEDEDTANEFIDEVYKPLIQKYHENVEWIDAPGPGKEPQLDESVFEDINVNYEKWLTKTNEWNRNNHGQHVSPKSESLTQIRDNVKNLKGNGEKIDLISGPLTGGIGPALAVEDIYADSELDLPHYSSYRFETEEVIPDINPENFEGLNVLVVDDVIESCETMENIVEYYKEHGAEKIYISTALLNSNSYDIEEQEIYESNELIN